jgi:hypothetical protein
LHTLRPGDHVVSGDDVYGGTYRLFERVMRPLGIDVSFTDLSNPSSLPAALRPETKLVWLESPTNPMLKLADIQGISQLARARGVPVLVDNTFAARPCSSRSNLVPAWCCSLECWRPDQCDCQCCYRDEWHGHLRQRWCWRLEQYRWRSGGHQR